MKTPEPSKMASEKAVDSRSIQELLLSLSVQEDSATKDHLKMLIQDASQPRHISGNSCTKLCYFLEQCRKSESSRLQELAYSRETCQDLFNFYIEWNEKNQHRSMRQVLGLLSSLISLNPDKAASNAFKGESLRRLFSIISHQSALPLVKPAFKVLEFFLAKGTYSVSDLFEAYGHVSSDIESSPVSRWDRLVSDVFEWMSLPETASAAAKFLVSLFGGIKLSPIESSENAGNYSIYWQRWIHQGLGRYPESLENVKNYLFPPLFKLDRLGSLQFLRNVSERSSIDLVRNREVDTEATLLLSAMEVGKKFGLVDDPDIIVPQKLPAKIRDFVELPSQAIGDLLVHTDTTIRSLAFSVLVSSLSSSRPFPKQSLDIIRQNLYVLHADADAKFRNDLFANTKHMLERLRGGLAFLTREASLNVAREHIATDLISGVPKYLQTAHNKEEIDKDGRSILMHIQEHEHFLAWYLNFLAQELVPTASYPRHITALKTLEILLKTGVQLIPGAAAVNTSRGSDTTWPKQVNIFSPSLCRLLLDLLLDPFEEVRNCTVCVLNFVPKSCFGPLSNTPHGPVPQLLQDLLSKAEMVSTRTGRADAGDGLAHINVLYFKLFDTDQQRINFFHTLVDILEQGITIALEDIETAADIAPLHGQLATIRQLWDLLNVTSYEGLVSQDSPDTGPEAGTIMAFQDKLVKCCINIWKVVKDTLCHDSPEGRAIEGPLKVGDVDVKSILSYSFRACHESSKLIQILLRKADVKSSDGASFLPFDLFEQLGRLTFEQLSTLRHRGAFSTVATTFSICCKLTQYNEFREMGGSSLLRYWTDQTFECINEQHSTTRRSAGLPGLITGILSAGSSDITFDSIIIKLQDIARTPVISSGKDEEQLPQVHAINSIKDIFKSATLGKQADMYITSCFVIATDSLKSNIWAISNCGLLLIKSLIDCMLGTSDSKATTEAGWDGRSIRISYDRYKGLPEVLLELLQSDTSTSAQAQKVFPALEFVRRVGPPEKDRALFREEFFNRVTKHLNCRIWDLRDLAARTASTFMLDDDWKHQVIKLLETDKSSTNRLHGVFLLIKYLIQKRLDLNKPTNKDDLAELLNVMSIRRMPYGENPTDQIVIAAYEEALFPIYNTFFKDWHGRNDSTLSSLFPEWEEQAQDMLQVVLSSLDAGNMRNASVSVYASLAKTKAVHLLYMIRTGKALTEIANGTIAWGAIIDDDIAAELLDRVLEVFGHADVSLDEAVALVRFFQLFIQCSNSSQTVKTIAHDMLSSVLKLHDFSSYSDVQVQELVDSLANTTFLEFTQRGIFISDEDEWKEFMGPDLTNARLVLKGMILRLQLHHFRRKNHYILDGCNESNCLYNFGMEVFMALRSSNDYDTRYAGAMACFNFYDTQENTLSGLLPSTRNIIMPLNVAILDCLNDDDSDIRGIGADTFACLTSSHTLVPEASAKAHSSWLLSTYCDSFTFPSQVLKRIACGNTDESFKLIEHDPLRNTSDELMHALVRDDALFAEEEQNLYVDEVRDARLWNDILAQARGPAWENAALKVVIWARASLHAIRYVEMLDGPLGWMSNPHAFAICARVMIAARTVVKRFESMKALQGVETIGPSVLGMVSVAMQLLQHGRQNGFHPLLMEELEGLEEFSRT